MLNSKQAKRLALLLTLAYMVSYITRINFGAIVSEIEADTQISRTILSTALTGSFITYGIGQIISGICGDIFSPKKLVTLGLFTSSVMNLIMPFCNNPYLMLCVWCVNGFAQAFMWPPIVKIMVYAFSKDYYEKTAVKISWASSYGTIIIYFIAPILISVLNWRAVFIFSAVCGFIMMLIWSKFAIEPDQSALRATSPQQQESNNSATKVLFSPFVIAIMVSIVIHGMLRDGVTTWMPTYISDTYRLGTAVSILTGIVLPLFSILCTQFSAVLYRKKLKSPVLCSAFMFLIGTVATVFLYFGSGSSVAISVICSATLAGSMHGITSMFTSMVPLHFKKYGNISTFSGALNACAYLGSGISAYGIALISENYGWDITLLIWIGLAVLGTLICFFDVKPWKKRFPY